MSSGRRAKKKQRVYLLVDKSAGARDYFDDLPPDEVVGFYLNARAAPEQRGLFYQTTSPTKPGPNDDMIAVGRISTKVLEQARVPVLAKELDNQDTLNRVCDTLDELRPKEKLFAPRLETGKAQRIRDPETGKMIETKDAMRECDAIYPIHTAEQLEQRRCRVPYAESGACEDPKQPYKTWESFLKAAGFGKLTTRTYVNMFKEQGVDVKNFDALTFERLLELGVGNREHRVQMMRVIQDYDLCQLEENVGVIWTDRQCVLSEKGQGRAAELEELHRKCKLRSVCQVDAGLPGGLPRYLRPYTRDFFKREGVHKPVPFCCKRQLRAVVKGALTYKRLKEWLRFKDPEEQAAILSGTRIKADDQTVMLTDVAQSNKDLKLMIAENSQQTDFDMEFLERFLKSVQVGFKNSLEQAFATQNAQLDQILLNEKFQKDREAEARKEAGLLWKTLQSVGAAVKVPFEAIWASVKFLVGWAASVAKLGLNIVKYVLEHPKLSMYMLYVALELKKRLCRKLSTYVFGTPEQIEVGVFEKAQEVAGDTFDVISTLAPKIFLDVTQRFFTGNGFQIMWNALSDGAVSSITTIVAFIPGVGFGISTALKASGFLTVMLSGVGPAVQEAGEIAVYAAMLSTVGEQFLELIMIQGCLTKPPIERKLTAAGIANEAKALADRLRTITFARGWISK